MRDLVDVRFRGALVLKLAGNDDSAVVMANARRSRSYFAAWRRLALRSEAEKLRNFCAVKAKRRLSPKMEPNYALIEKRRCAL